MRNELHTRKAVRIGKLQHTQAMLDHHKDIVAPTENIFIYLQAASASKEKVIIGTDATYSDESITLEEVQNTMEMEQAVFDNPPKIILTGYDKDEHDGDCQTYQEKTDRLPKNI